MFGVDVGGTFTDVVAFRDGRIEVTKVPSSRTAPAQPVVEGPGGWAGPEAAPSTTRARTRGRPPRSSTC